MLEALLNNLNKNVDNASCQSLSIDSTQNFILWKTDT